MVYYGNKNKSVPSTYSYAVAHESIRKHRGEGRKSRKNYRNKYGFPEWRVK